jgi:hypothetical protein
MYGSSVRVWQVGGWENQTKAGKKSRPGLSFTRHAMRAASFFLSLYGPGLQFKRMAGTRKFLCLGSFLFFISCSSGEE